MPCLFLAKIVIIFMLYVRTYANGYGSILQISLFSREFNLMVIYASTFLPFITQMHGMETIIALGMAAKIVALF